MNELNLQLKEYVYVWIYRERYIYVCTFYFKNSVLARYIKINMFIILTLLEHIKHFCVKKYRIMINSHPISQSRAHLINFLETEKLNEHNHQA